MLAKAERLAKKEHRTMSELIREALRRYEREREWNRLNEYGRSRASALGISERDVVGIVKAYRKEQREKRPAARR